MALKAVHVSDVPLLDQVPESPSSLLSTSRLSLKGPESVRASFKAPKFLVIGHRGKGMNALASADRRLKAVKENTVLSFNEAARFPVDFVEFDVQVTKDGCPIVFHDNFILTEEDGILSEKRVTELHLEEFLSYGPQQHAGRVGKSLHRKTKDGRLLSWKVETDDALCTLQEVFLKVDPKLGFNVELKFDDDLVYSEEELTWALQAILQVVFEFAKERPVIFSSFQPDAAQLMRKLQSTYPGCSRFGSGRVKAIFDSTRTDPNIRRTRPDPTRFVLARSKPNRISSVRFGSTRQLRRVTTFQAGTQWRWCRFFSWEANR